MTRSSVRASRQNAEPGLNGSSIPWPHPVILLTRLPTGYCIFPQLTRILPSMGAPPYLVEQHARPSTVRQGRETTTAAGTLCGIRVDWQCLAMSF